MGTKRMKNIFCGRFFWNRINEDVERTHREWVSKRSLEEVEEDLREHPPNLTQMAPAESISIRGAHN